MARHAPMHMAGPLVHLLDLKPQRVQSTAVAERTNAWKARMPGASDH